MSLRSILCLLRALRAASLNHLNHFLRRFWSPIWRFIRQRAFLVGSSLPSSTTPSTKGSSTKTLQRGVDLSRGELMDTISYTVNEQPSLHPNSAYNLSPTHEFARSQSSIMSYGNDISLQVMPPDSADPEGGAGDPGPPEASSSSHRQSTISILTSGGYDADNISHQKFQVLQPSSLRASRESLVIPQSVRLVVQQNDSRTSISSDCVGPCIYPIMPNQIPRYDRTERKADYAKDAEYQVQAGEQEFLDGEIPEGWGLLIHPGGQPYFYHPEKRIVTDEWIYNPEKLGELKRFIAMFEEFSRLKDICQPHDVHLVLETKEDDDGILWCGYYYACASSRNVFWLETHDINEHLGEVQGDIAHSHIKLFLEREYWCHWDLFPDIQKTTNADYELLAKIINDARIDVLSSNLSTVNYTVNELKEMARTVNFAAKQFSKGRDTSNWCIGRYMHPLMKARFINFHGQFSARLDPTQSVYGFERRRRSWFIKALSPLLFAAPNVHLEKIEELWADRVTMKERCLNFFNNLNKQWGEHIVHASILLNANVGFLAIPSNDASNNSTVGVLPARSAAQIMSYLSIIANFSSMMIALLLVRRHKNDERPTVGDLDKYFRRRENPVLGFEYVASVYSLPYALLTWGMVTFMTAFVLMCFQISTTITRVTIGGAILLMCVFIGWCIAMSWVETEFQWRKRFTEYREKITAKFSVAVEVWPRHVVRLLNPVEPPVGDAEAGIS